MNFSDNIRWDNALRWSSTRIGCVAFVYAMVAGLLVQLVVLPVWFPTFHAGDGLLAGNDAAGFHRIAVGLAETIVAEGWGTWELRPDGQAPAGIMAAVYVYLPHEPWAVLPIYAGLFASSAAVLFAILRLAGFSSRAAGVGVTPLLLLPSAALLFAIPHKDAFSLCGNLLFLYSLMRLIALPLTAPRRELWGGLAGSLMLGLTGVLLVWLVRPYEVEIMRGGGIVVAVVVTIALVARMIRREIVPSQCMARLFAIWLLLLLVGNPFIQKVGWLDMFSAMEPVGKTEPVAEPVAEPVTEPVAELVAKTGSAVEDEEARTSPWFFAIIKEKVSRLAEIRKGYLAYHATAASAVDVSVNFDNMEEMVVYLPRALQIGLFAPFPKDWIGEGSLAVNTFMRRLVAVEMVLWYGACLFWVLALMRGPNLMVGWLLAAYALFSLLIFVYAIPNMGTLYRMRFGFWIMLFAIGTAMAATLFEKQHVRKGGAAGPALGESCAA